MPRAVTMIPATKNIFTASPINAVSKRRVAGYARVSTDSEEQFSSYEAQIDYYSKYIKSRDDWKYVSVYTDEGISATNTKHRDGFNQKFYGDRKQTTIWEFDKPTKSKLHPTMKPLPLIAYPMRNSSQVNGVVLDLFGGSGSTLIVAEQLDRTACLMELDTKYASVIVRRFAAYCGNTDAISVIRNGEKLACKEVYVPTEDDLSIKDGDVEDLQKVGTANE